MQPHECCRSRSRTRHHQHRRGRSRCPIISLLLMSSDFDIHDSVADTAPVQDPDRFIFSNENVAGDPTQYTRADDLADYVLNKIVARSTSHHLSHGMQRSKPWALVAQLLYRHLSRAARSHSMYQCHQQLYLQHQPAAAVLPDGSSATARVSPIRSRSRNGRHWLTSRTGRRRPTPTTFPEDKIPSLPTGKIIGIREYVEDRVAAPHSGWRQYHLDV